MALASGDGVSPVQGRVGRGSAGRGAASKGAARRGLAWLGKGCRRQHGDLRVSLLSSHEGRQGPAGQIRAGRGAA